MRQPGRAPQLSRLALAVDLRDGAAPDAAITLPAAWSRDQVIARQHTDAATIPASPGPCDASRGLHGDAGGVRSSGVIRAGSAYQRPVYRQPAAQPSDDAFRLPNHPPPLATQSHRPASQPVTT